MNFTEDKYKDTDIDNLNFRGLTDEAEQVFNINNKKSLIYTIISILFILLFIYLTITQWMASTTSGIMMTTVSLIFGAFPMYIIKAHLRKPVGYIEGVIELAYNEAHRRNPVFDDNHKSSNNIDEFYASIIFPSSNQRLRRYAIACTKTPDPGTSIWIYQLDNNKYRTIFPDRK